MSIVIIALVLAMAATFFAATSIRSFTSGAWKIQKGTSFAFLPVGDKSKISKGIVVFAVVFVIILIALL